MPYLLDANVLCESSRSHPDTAVTRWLAEHDADLHVSVLTLGEMIKGIHLMDAGKRRAEVEAWFQRIERWAGRRMIPVTADIMHFWGVYYARHQKAGRKLPLMDSLLAATALQANLTLVTRNTGDFPDDIPVINPWLA